MKYIYRVGNRNWPPYCSKGGSVTVPHPVCKYIRFYENACLGFSHCSEIFRKLFVWPLEDFFTYFGHNPAQYAVLYPCQNFFSHFWVKVSLCIWVLSQLTGWIFISRIFNDNSRISANFLRMYCIHIGIVKIAQF